MDTKITDGGGSFLQNISYNYNERGWLLGSSAPLFEMQLQYNNITGVTGITPMAQYNGNIASQSWGTSASPNTKSYTYLYDNLNRLTSGISTDNFSERGITYDLNGNIQTLQRTYGSTTPIDNLVYTYNGTNQVQSINDSAPDNSNYGYRPGLYSNYKYDVNGNMSVLPTPPNGSAVADIDIQYNLLNLPQTITGGKTITYTYDANGNKLRRVSPATGSTDYISGIQYDQAVGAATPTLSFIQTEEGKAVPLSTGGYDYYYYMGDNLGNTRITFDTKADTAVVLQQDDYLPFGYEISRNTVTSPKNEYLYNKKELQEELAEYDYGARFYDPVIARWNTIDPLAEMSRRWSPYNYVEDDPIRLTDPDGMESQCNPCGVPGQIEEAPEIGEALGAVAKAGLVAIGMWGLHATITHHLGSNPVMQQDATRTMAPQPAIVQTKRVDNGLTRDKKHIDDRHVDRNQHPNKSKYKKPNQAEKLEKRTIDNPDQTTTQNDGRKTYEKDYGRENRHTGRNRA